MRTLTASTGDEVEPLLDALRQAGAEGLHAAGFLSYEAGAAFEPRLAHLPLSSTTPLAWFGLFEGSEEVPDAADLLPDPAGAWLGRFAPEVTQAEYSAAFASVHEQIEAGEIYQANLTFRAHAPYAGNPLAVYAGLRRRAAAPYSAVVWTGEQWILSASPELYVAVASRRVTAAPMKGTAPRLADPVEDAAVAAALRTDPKQQAENVMIVDLLRNDLGRVATPGTVSVRDLFALHTYPTVHQLTSTVTADLRDGLDTLDLVRASFPCGSVTGAPKIRAMEIIGSLEASPRGVYCGAIGHIRPSGDASFNVAIRTLTLDGHTATVGLGSGIVADSTADAEWAECWTKAEFLRGRDDLSLLETVRADPSGVARLELHLARLTASAAALGFICDEAAVRRAIDDVISALDEPVRLRLVLSPTGEITTSVSPLPAPPVTPWLVEVVPLPVETDDVRLRHKTTDRAFHDDARSASTADEVVFVRPDGLVTEGSITALFVPRDGTLLTPRTGSGLLDSVLRRELLLSGDATEADLTVADLGGEFFLGNSVRGLVAARLIDPRV